ncbi:MAG: PAS domain S-box protein [Alicyclobacillaceae bacterium]|nr:PAS domain S-box protein [Alicyclobacillaceae bacterium]
MIKEILQNIEVSMKQLADINKALDETLIVAVTDRRGVITFVNQKFCEISKYSRDELLGQTHRIINSGYHPKEFFSDMWRTIGSGKVWRGEIRNRAKDGSYYWVDTTIVPCLDENGRPYQYVSFRIDITQRKLAEEHLRRMDRIEVAGQLASSIAHEIRNPLAAIQWSLRSLSDDPDERRRQVDLILSELERLDQTVGELLLLSRPRDAKFGQQDVRRLLDMVVTLMNIQARKHGVQIVADIAADLPEIRCEQNHLKQVFINLIKNAMEAMPNGGRIFVRAQRHGEDHVLIEVQDEGCGIPPEQLPKLGEPFFTTKEKGTGLGLMVCYKIIQDHKGKLTIQSEVDKGTTVQVLLPVA